MSELTETALFVPAPSTVRGAGTKLGTSPDGKLISYGAGRNAVIRPIDQSGPSQLYGHPANVTVVKISPAGGFYAASGDVNGNFKVWDTTGSVSTPKLEAKPIARINDIAWDAEGKRLVLVGDGRAGFGATFSLDTGASIGEISGHSKIVNSVAMRPSRPFRAVTASDDMTVCVSNGVPFKFTSQSRKHSRFVTSVDYAPSGSLFVSAGSDGSAFLYDGTTGDDRSTLDDGTGAAHKGTIFQASFAKDSARIATSGADGLVKLWDVATNKVVQTWDFAGSESSALLSQQVGNVWAGDEIVALSFSGVLSILDVRMPAPSRKLYGHQTAVTALAHSPSTGDYLSGDSTGVVRRFSSRGVCSPVGGAGHSNLVVGIVPSGDDFFSTAYDDSVKALSTTESTSLSTGAIPKGLAAGVSGTIYLATAKDVQALTNGQKVASLAVSYGPTSIAASQDGTFVAVGGEDSKCHLYSTKTKGTFELVAELPLRVAVTSCAFSPDSSKLAVGGTDGKILLFEVSTQTLLHARFSFQSARVNSLAFDASGARLAAGSLDESIRVYSLAAPSTVLTAKNVHRGGVASVLWENDDVLVSGGADGAVKKLKV